MDRLGVGCEVLHRINPRLVYASGSGYGLTGPDRDNLAMDLTIQAVSGLIAATGFPDGPPVKAGPAVVDFISGIHLYAATLTALLREHPCPSTGSTTGRCPGYIKDHVRPLACGGPDAVSNLQWQTIRDARAKDRWERQVLLGSNFRRC